VANNSVQLTGLPLPLAPNSEKWTEAYMQYYTYLHHVLDQQIDKVLKTLSESGLREDTIVVFVPDHGEYGGSHGQMMQKWHTAYQEAIHVPVVISMPPKHHEMTTNKSIKEIEELTSHIDIVPTLLGLAGVTPKKLKKLRKNLGGREVPKFVGADLSDLITGKVTKVPDHFAINGNDYRDSILFTTSDMITEPISRSGSSLPNPEDYQIYLDAVDNYINQVNNLSTKPANNLTNKQQDLIRRMKPGSVVQPAEIHCVRENNVKLVRYRDYYDPYNEDKFQWEMYDLDNDPAEVQNLLKYKTDPNEPQFVTNQLIYGKDRPMVSMTPENIIEKANHLYTKMLALIDKML